MQSLLRVHIFLNRLCVACLIMAYTALPSTATVLIDICPTHPQQWVCFGYIEMHGPLSTTRISSYTNNEMLVEREQFGKRWRLINTGKGIVVDHLEKSDSPSPFTADFLSDALGPIFLTLPLAYPDGPGSVQVKPITRTVEIDRNNTATLTTSRGVDREIHFDIQIVGDDIPRVRGVYHAGALPALPGDFDLRGWYRALDFVVPGQAPRKPELAPERLEMLRCADVPC